MAGPRKTSAERTLRLVIAVSLVLLAVAPLNFASADGPAGCYAPLEINRKTTHFSHERFVLYSDGSHDVLMGAEEGIVRYVPGSRTLGEPIGTTGAVYDFANAGDASVLIGAQKGLFLFRYNNNEVVRLVPDVISTAVWSLHSVPGGSIVVGTATELYRYDNPHHVVLLHIPVTFPALDAFGDKHIRWIFYDENAGRILIGANFQPLDGDYDSMLFTYTTSDGVISRVTTPTINWITAFQEDGAGGVLIGAKGLLRYHATRPLETLPGISTSVYALAKIEQNSILVASADGLSRYDPITTGIVKVEKWPGGAVFNLLDDGAGGVLVGTQEGLYRYKAGKFAKIEGEMGFVNVAALQPDGGRGQVLFAKDFEGGRLYYGFIQPPLSAGTLTLENRQALEGHLVDSNGIEFRFLFTKHPCVPLLEQLGVQVVAMRDGKDRLLPTATPEPAVGFERSDGGVRFKATLPVPGPGRWRIKVVSSPGGIELPVGQFGVGPFSVATSQNGRIVKISSEAIPILLALLNLLVLVTARYFPSAWNLATDDSWGTWGSRLGTLLVSHWRPAQLWVLDLYVRRQRATLLGDKAEPYLSMPLTNSTGKSEDSEVVVSSFIEAGHLWVQGSSGMGKTSLVRHMARNHFTGSKATSFFSFRRDGYVLIRVDARRFAEKGTDEKRDPSWVIECIRSVLSSHGLNFENDRLLRAMVRSGVLAIAIDGLGEVGHSAAVAAFADRYPEAPLLVTSQDAGQAPFEVWRLPFDIKDQVASLLHLYLADRSYPVLERLKVSGLLESIRSGYDVRLVADLSESDPTGAEFPRDRAGLYQRVMDAAWPEGAAERVSEDKGILEAAAWSLCSERGPNEDKRQLRPDVDAPVSLLEALVIAGDMPGRHVKLIRRTGAAFEFVHDQMNAFLAAVWLARRPTVSQMVEMLSSSKVWMDTESAQQVLWSFVVPLLKQSDQRELWDEVLTKRDWRTLREALEEAMRNAGHHLSWQ